MKTKITLPKEELDKRVQEIYHHMTLEEFEALVVAGLGTEEDKQVLEYLLQPVGPCVWLPLDDEDDPW